MNNQRVQIPVHTDRWMMGDRFGELVKVTKARGKTRDRIIASDPRRYWGCDIEFAHVKLDKSGKTMRFILSDCEII